MKKSILIALASLALCAFAPQTKHEIKTSKILWKGFKVGSENAGEIKLKSGYFEFNSGKITGGEFVVDMNTITCTNLQGGWRDKLVEHLKSDDFFSVKKFPVSKLTLKKVKYLGARKYDAEGELTIKGTTKPIKIALSQSEKGVITATVKVDRTLYDIKYNSDSFFKNLGDKLIKDEFEISVEFTI